MQVSIVQSEAHKTLGIFHHINNIKLRFEVLSEGLDGQKVSSHPLKALTQNIDPCNNCNWLFYFRCQVIYQLKTSFEFLHYRKSILDDVSQYVKAYAERYSNLADALASSVNEVKDENPYEPFIVKKG